MDMTSSIRAASLLVLTLALAACGDTWRGAKQDTGDNMRATGETLNQGGAAVQPTPRAP